MGRSTAKIPAKRTRVWCERERGAAEIHLGAASLKAGPASAEKRGKAGRVRPLQRKGMESVPVEAVAVKLR